MKVLKAGLAVAAVGVGVVIANVGIGLLIKSRAPRQTPWRLHAPYPPQ